MTEQKAKRLIKDLNGLEVIYIEEGNVQIPAIILADWDRGIGIKPTGTPQETQACYVKQGEEPPSIKRLGNPRYCLVETKTSGVREWLAEEKMLPWDKQFLDAYKAAPTTGKFDASEFSGLSFSRPSCPFA